MGDSQNPTDPLLSAEQVQQLTGYKKASYQRRALEHMGIPYLRRPDGAPVVSEACVRVTLA